MNKLLEMSFESAKAVSRVHKAERLARGVKVVDTDPVSNPGSTQGGAEWRVTEYQPERKEPPPDRHSFIFATVSPCPHRPLLISGKLLNGHSAVSS
jgi:hypothetical protein